MTNENVKTQVINDVIVAMSAYIAADLIQILERVIVDKTIDVVMERINTLPAEIKDSVDQQNEYIRRKSFVKGLNMVIWHQSNA